MKQLYILILIAAFITGCSKNKTLLEEPAFARIKIKVIGTQAYRASLNSKIIGDTVSSTVALDKYVTASNRQQLLITNVSSQQVIVDTLIDLPAVVAAEFLVLEADPQSRPLFLSAADLTTTPPARDSLKLNFLNLDTAVTKNKRIDLAFYQFAASVYTLKGELKNIPYQSFSAYVQLPSNISTFFFEIKDSGTGQVLVSKESRTGRLNRPSTYQSNNVFSMLFKGNGSNNSYTPTVLIQQRL